MKKIIKNITLCGLVAVGVGMGFSSCEDFLTITPTDRIVEEEFWQDKRDLKNAIIACYWRLSNSDILCKYIYWGEERSDNFDYVETVLSANSPEVNIMKVNLLPTYGQFNWTPMYQVINYCNKVLSHGGDVLANDESFLESDWKPIRAEAITLRALCHFYLVRTFGEIPYVTEDFNNDSQELRVPQSTQLTVLNNIINDLESIKDEAMLDYGNDTDNKSRVTRKMVHTLLADVYLWRASYKAGNNQPFRKVTLSSNYAGGHTKEELASRYEDYGTTAEADYQKCIEYCDLVIDRMIQEKKDYLSKNGGFIGATSITISDLLVSHKQVGDINIYAYDRIFGSGNSDETILELQIDGTSSSNTMITSLFWNIEKTREAAFRGSFIMRGAAAEPNKLDQISLFTKTDYRYLSTFKYQETSGGIEGIIKYVALSNAQTNNKNAKNPDIGLLTDNRDKNTLYVSQTMRSKDNLNANWIVYRLSEVYLMKAEAMSQLYSDEDNLKEAFSYVDEVYKRSNPKAYEGSSTVDRLDFKAFNTSKNLESLVMTERQREFIGEGRRWYDLVRYALRRGNTSEMLELLTRKYIDTGDAVKAKLADIQSLYSPVYNSEIKNNNLLYQNGVWYLNESSSKTDDL